MTDSEKPLYVRVAEALGHRIMEHWPEGKEAGYSHFTLYEGGDTPSVPRYDTDWSATGPLIEKYGIDLWKSIELGNGDAWMAQDSGLSDWPCAGGATPLTAVCNLILALAEAGKLEAK